jgi:Big-like domain-containing protein/invasin-like protein/calcineurin-like phosphoesterase family protein
MRPFPHRLSWQAILLTLVLAPLACSDTDNPTRPSVRALFTTPTGLVTATPPQVFVGAGDITSCGNNNDEATAKLIDSIPGTVYILGDDAYDNGTTAEFANCYDPTWGRAKARTYPSPGNHEYNTSGAAPYFAYFGAVAGTPGQGWYSFNLGAWHIISLNSNISLSAGGAQDTWLKADLAAHPNQCTLAYYHHPLYSSTGGTGTGGLTYSSSRMFVNDLYAAHADLILNGHRHFYERLAPMNPSGGYDSLKGVRELIAGTGGIGGGSETNLFPLHEAGDGSTFGVLKLWLYDDSYAWKFVPVAGKTYTDSGSTPCHSAGGGSGGVSASISTVSASPTTLTAGGGSSTITVTATDGSGNPVSGATVVLSASGSGNTLTQPSGTTNSSGVATGSISSTKAETKTISATANGVAITQTATVTVGPAPASALGFFVQPTNTVANTTMSPAVQVEVRDQYGNRVTTASNSIAMAIGTNPAAGTLSGTAPVAAVNGVATFSDLSIDQPATGYTLAASSTGLAGATSSAFNITSSAPSVSAGNSTVSAAPTSITAGSGTSTITVTAKDVNGNAVSGATVVLTATGSGNTLNQPASVTDVAGVATGTLSSTVAETKTVSATANGVAITQTASVTVTASSSGGTITHTLLTSGHDPTNTQTYTTASIAPAPNTLVIVAVLTHQGSAAAPSPTLTGGGMASWDVIGTVAYDGSTPLDRLTIYRAMSTSPGSGSITIKSSVTVSNCQWIVSQWGGVDASGTNGSGAIVQTGSGSGTSVNGLTVTLAPFLSSSDAAYGAFGVASATAVVTAGSGFTTIDQQPSGESTIGDLFAEWAVNLNPINATWSSKSAGALGIEIKSAP